MSSPKPSSILNLADWQTESLRATAFCGATISQEQARAWWESFGSEEHEVIERPKAEIRQYTGTLDESRVVLRIEGSRVDLVLAPALAEQDAPDDVPSIGAADLAIDRFAARASSWLAQVPRITRVAYGATLLHPVSKRAVGYDLLNRLIANMALDGTRTSDFAYQINRFYDSNAVDGGIRVNRLRKWSVQLFQRLLVAGVVAPEAMLVEREASAVRLELDINTAPRKTPVESASVVALFDELVAAGRRIAERGDSE